MDLLIISVACLIVITGMLIVYRYWYVRRKLRRQTTQKLKVFEGLIGCLNAGEEIPEETIYPLAKNPSTRHALFGLLESFGRTDIFPAEYFSHEKGAESFLVNWLEFPTELNAAPREIELFTKITLQQDGDALDYFVFKYRKDPPSPARKENQWMLGVAGPYGSESQPYDIPQRIFSRFKELGTISAMEEVRWVHEHISR